MKRTLSIISVISLLCFLAGCSANIQNVPPGYVGKLLTPSGWETGIREAGQVDIGQEDNSGRGNQLVLLEATAVQVKESFTADENGEDHRVLTRNRNPVAVDFYVQVMVPTEAKLRDSIFSQVTPTAKGSRGRVSVIKLDSVYYQFASPIIRGKTREIFAKYPSYDSVMENYSKVTDEISAMVAETFRESNVPLRLVAAQLSNVKADKTIWTAENNKAAADAQVAVIEKIGEAIRKNPGYLQKYKWDQLEKIAGKGTTIIVSDDGSKPAFTLPVNGR